MKYLPPPTDENEQPLDPMEVFETCISTARPALKARLQAVCAKVVAEAVDYNTKASNQQLFLKQPHNQVGTVPGEEMVKVYTNRLVPKRGKGRPTYDRIMSAPVHGRCPLCGIGTVNTLDHYLPKKNFPIYSVTPNNLVPACQWCQREKGEYFSETADGQLLHPYFDDINNEIWLAAKVVPGAEAVFRYFASPPDHWTQEAKARVVVHLDQLNLLRLYRDNAGSRLSEIRTRLVKLYQQGGEKAVRAHLQEELDSAEDDHLNSWVAAMYRAAVASDWFCNESFREN